MSTIQQLLTDHLDIWTAANTAKKSGRGRSAANAGSVYGIKKLRELILELAVHGKLVPQDPNDEPASKLLQRIQAEKTKLIAEEKIKKAKSLPPIAENEKLLDLPQGWEWARFIDTYSLEYGDNLPAEKRSNSGEYPVYGSNGVVGSHNLCFVHSPCIVVGRKGSAGALNLSLENGCCVTDVAYYCIPSQHLDLIFSFKLFHTIGLDSLGKGIKPGLNRNEVYELPIAIPPLAEQRRIVTKVDKLMALCDQLESQHNNAIEAHEQLVNHLLDTLTKTQGAENFNENWQRIAIHFGAVFTTEASIDSLKQTLLRLAVMGKLVQQDPNDEPASELLKRIQTEKARLTAEGKVKRGKDQLLTAKNEKQIAMPNGWACSHLADLVNILNGRAYKKDELLNAGMPVLRVGNLFTSNHWYYSNLILEDDKYCNRGDLLFAWSASFGPFIWDGEKAIYHYHIWKMDLYDSDLLYMRYLYTFLLEQTQKIKASGHGVAMIHMTKEKMEKLLVPLPPLAEQHRIVARVDELMAICDKLKARITEANQLQQKIADVLIEQTVA
ncbi:MAG: restriction endonuclease subunit S [Gammaproteobacteria bacterium]|nr:restriction endonuclease subunit S [Gammaproteobacteria bacterium]